MPRLPQRCLYPADWPEDLRQAWARACTPDLLRRRGLAAKWSEPTRQHVRQGVGAFLFWARQNAGTDFLRPFPDIVTEDRVMAFAEARRAEIRDVSVRSQLV